MANTTTPSVFMKRLGIAGHVTTTNGARLHIERVRARFAVKDRETIQQRVFIDLDTYSAHCFTFAENFTPGQCLRESRDVQRCLAPIARLARMAGLKADSKVPDITQARLVSFALAEAGVATVLVGSRFLTLDCATMGRLSKVKDMNPFTVSIRPTDSNTKWGRIFETPKAVGNVSEGLEVHVVGQDDHFGAESLKAAAEKIMREVFGHQWNTATR